MSDAPLLGEHVFPSVSSSAGLQVVGNTVGGDLYAASELRQITNLWSLGKLRATPINRAALDAFEFVTPAGFDKAAALLAEPGVARTAHLVVLLAGPGTGADTAACRLLHTCLTGGESLVRLTPDWEDGPAAENIPVTSGCGLLLDLRGEPGRISEPFRTGLAQLAADARERRAVLVLIADPVWWGAVGDGKDGVFQQRLGRPAFADVVAANLPEEHRGRVGWLAGKGRLGYVPSGHERPSVAVAFAEILAGAAGEDDDQAANRLHSWDTVLDEWIDAELRGDPAAVERRATRIAGAFFPGARVQVVIDVKDVLLGQPELNWPAQAGGPLAGAAAWTQCEMADLSIGVGGTVSLEEKHPGITQALINRLLRHRPNLTPVLRRWLLQVTGPGGVARAWQRRVIGALVAAARDRVAEDGLSEAVALIEAWIGAEEDPEAAITAADARLATAVLQELAVDVEFGPTIRAQLTVWAKRRKSPERQLAVVRVCAGTLGHTSARVALTRLSHVLENAANPDVRHEAATALRALAADPESGPQIVHGLVTWAEDPRRHRRAVALSVLLDTLRPAEGEQDVSVVALAGRDDAQGGTLSDLLVRGWKALWTSELQQDAGEVFQLWRAQAEAGQIPVEFLARLASELLQVESGPKGVLNMLGGRSDFRRRLINALPIDDPGLDRLPSDLADPPDTLADPGVATAADQTR